MQLLVSLLQLRQIGCKTVVTSLALPSPSLAPPITESGGMQWRLLSLFCGSEYVWDNSYSLTFNQECN